MAGEMVERVALAIEEAMRSDPYMPDVARAAIKALRDPADKVLMAMSPMHNLPWARERWNWGVDAALQDGDG